MCVDSWLLRCVFRWSLLVGCMICVCCWLLLFLFVCRLLFVACCLLFVVCLLSLCVVCCS